MVLGGLLLGIMEVIFLAISAHKRNFVGSGHRASIMCDRMDNWVPGRGHRNRG